MDSLKNEIEIVDAPETELVEKCPLCKSGESNFLFWNFDRIYHLPGEFGTIICKTCQLVRLSPRPTVQAIAKYYPEDYGAYVNPASINAISDGDKLGVRNAIRNTVLSSLGYDAGHLRLWQKILRPLLSRIYYKQGTYGYGDLFPRFVPEGRALEIGCGNGFFLTYLKKHGWEVKGIDLSSHAARQAKELFDIDVFNGEIQDAPYEPESFDFIRLSHVVEHFFDPLESMKSVYSLLKPGGIVYVEVPNAEGIGAEISGPYWYGWDAPRHLFMFTPSTINQTLKDAGFKKVKTRTHLWDSFAWAMNYKFEEESGERLENRPIVRTEDSPQIEQDRREAQTKFSMRPNDGDIISCWAVKPSL